MKPARPMPFEPWVKPLRQPPEAEEGQSTGHPTNGSEAPFAGPQKGVRGHRLKAGPRRRGSRQNPTFDQDVLTTTRRK